MDEYLDDEDINAAIALTQLMIRQSPKGTKDLYKSELANLKKQSSGNAPTTPLKRKTQPAKLAASRTSPPPKKQTTSSTSPKAMNPSSSPATRPAKPKKTNAEKEAEKIRVGNAGEEAALKELLSGFVKDGYQVVSEIYKKPWQQCRLSHPDTQESVKITWCNALGESGYPYDFAITKQDAANNTHIQYIEVKSTKKNKPAHAVFSAGELRAMKDLDTNYSIYRVYNVLQDSPARVVTRPNPYYTFFQRPADQMDHDGPAVGSLTSALTELRIKM